MASKFTGLAYNNTDRTWVLNTKSEHEKAHKSMKTENRMPRRLGYKTPSPGR